jgi:hypothetical protein
LFVAKNEYRYNPQGNTSLSCAFALRERASSHSSRETPKVPSLDGRAGHFPPKAAVSVCAIESVKNQCKYMHNNARGAGRDQRRSRANYYRICRTGFLFQPITTYVCDSGIWLRPRISGCRFNGIFGEDTSACVWGGLGVYTRISRGLAPHCAEVE